MLPKDLGNFLNVLKKMEEHELIMAELYRTCSQVWPVDRKFWNDMEQMEMRHAQNINKIMKLVSERPESFEWGHPFKIVAIQTAVKGIKSNIQKLKKGKLTLYRTFFIARDIEQSILENKYGEIVKTNDREFKSLINEIVSDTINHRNQLDKKIKEWVS